MIGKELQDAIKRELDIRQNIRSGLMADDGDSFNGLPCINTTGEIELIHGVLPESEEGSEFIIDAYLPFGILVKQLSSKDDEDGSCKILNKFFVPYTNIKFISEGIVTL